MPTTALRTCPLCEATCGLVLELDGDRITRVTGDPDHPLSRGYVCPKGAAIRELDHDPDRLVRPRIRAGDGWRDVDWEEAFAFIGDRLAEVDATHGREAVGAYLGNPSVHTLAGQLYGKSLLKALRPGFVASASTVDQMPKHRSSAELFGDPLAVPVPDIDRCQLLVVLGGNPLMSNGSLWTVPDVRRRLREMQSRGGRLVVVDPRRSRTARMADEHVAIRPGTDGLLLAAVARTLLDEDLVRIDHLAGHVAGLDQLPGALAELGPDDVAESCGVGADVIRGLARDLAATERAAVYGRIGTTTTPHGTLASWLVDVCNVLAGNLDRPGGAMFARTWHEDRSGRPAQRFGRFHSRVSGHPEVLGEFPAAALAEEIETPGPGRVRALFCIAGNPVLSTPDGPRLDAALADLDLLVCVDPYVTATSRRADVILPPPALRYRGHADLALTGFAVRHVLQYTPPALPLPEGQMAEEEILLRLGAVASGAGADVDHRAMDDLVAAALAAQLATRPTARTGTRTDRDLLESVAPRRGPERLLDLLLRSGPFGDGFGDHPEGWSLDRLADHPHGVDLGPLEPRVPEVLTTTSGRIELAPAALVDDVARLRELCATTGAAETLLVGRRHLRTNNSWMHNVPSLQRGGELCTLHLHPDDADRWGIADGSTAEVRSATGHLRVVAEVTDDIRPGVVSLPHGFGHDLDGVEQSVARRRPGVNVNVLVTRACIDPLSGTSGLTAVPVEVTAT